MKNYLINNEIILGVRVDTIKLNEIENFISGCKNRSYICCIPAHSIMECQKETKLFSIFNKSSLNTPDGMSIVWILKLLGHKKVERVYGPDILLHICANSSSNKFRHFFYGGTEQVLHDLTDQLKKMFPSIDIVGSYSPKFSTSHFLEEDEICNNISETKPDIIWVGLGSPKQEIWMHEHINRINVPIMIGIGAAFDFISGHKPQAPKFIQFLGFEWLFRFLHEPRRLWKRYLLYPEFVFLVSKEIILKWLYIK